jgi:hypothetical protein
MAFQQALENVRQVFALDPDQVVLGDHFIDQAVVARERGLEPRKECFFLFRNMRLETLVKVIEKAADLEYRGPSFLCERDQGGFQVAPAFVVFGNQ